jgi:hypothetical protein
MTASLEGPGSSIDQILDKAPARQNGGPSRAPATAPVAADDAEGGRMTLAERIRALQARSGR